MIDYIKREWKFILFLMGFGLACAGGGMIGIFIYLGFFYLIKYLPLNDVKSTESEKKIDEV